MKFLKLAICACTALTIAALAGCAITHGSLDVAKAEQIKVGTTTKSEILQQFGNPPVRNSYSGRDMWAYRGGVETGNILSGTTGHDMTSLTLTFTNEVVATCQITRIANDVWTRTATQDSHECGKRGL
jgi:outer membrane protein assembly factor BamE (lipoprotein component of BamABCDE complex)